MDLKDNLILEIGKQLNIPKVEDPEWKCRAVYSATGKMALASVWDNEEGQAFISPQHFTLRAREVLNAYLSIYPQISTYFPRNTEELAKSIYETYLNTGHFYHAAYKLFPCAYAEAQAEGITLCRGAAPGRALYMSGLGTYSVNTGAKQTMSVADLFGLQTQTLKSFLEELLEGERGWSEIQLPESAEFLSMEPQKTGGYWIRKPYRDGRISLFRYGAVNQIYAFYRMEQDHLYQKVIPEWRIMDHRPGSRDGYVDYRRIAAALFDKYGTLPPIKAKFRGAAVEVRLGYLLPLGEMDFFRLYSWPIRFTDTASDFNRVMMGPVFILFKQQLEHEGYWFEEDKIDVLRG